MSGALAGATVADESASSLNLAKKGPTGLVSLDDLTEISSATIMAQEDGDAPMSSLSIGGYVEAAYTWNTLAPDNDPGGPLFAGGGSENNGRIFDTEHNDFLLHSAQIAISKEATNDSWVGFNIVAMTGHDAKLIHTPGLNSFDDLDVMDAYLSIHIPDDVKVFGGGTLIVGKFETIVGAEVISNTDNINYSRSYSFGYAIPFAHVGALYSQDVTEQLSVDVGIANSAAGRAEDDNDSKAFLGRITVKPADIFDIAVATVIGNEPTTTLNSDTRAVLDFVANLRMPNSAPPILQPLSFSLNYDIGGQEGGNPNGGSAKWYGFSGIAKYKCNKQWYVAFRGERYRDSEGFTIGLTDGNGVLAKDYMELTGTIGYQPWDNLLLRAEWRYDKASRDVFLDDAAGNGLSNYRNTLALNAIVTF